MMRGLKYKETKKDEFGNTLISFKDVQNQIELVEEKIIIKKL